MLKRIAILFPRMGIYPHLARMLAETLSELGYEATVPHQPTADLLEFDVVIFSSRHVSGLENICKTRRGGKPVTVLWLFEPLPPVELSPLGEAIGRRAARCDWSRLPRAARRALDCVVPFRSHLVRGLRRFMVRPYSREVLMLPRQNGWIRFDTENFFYAVGEWFWIQKIRANGWLDFCFATNQSRVRFLKSRGIDAELIPFGHHRDWGRDLNLPRDVDVLFLGARVRGPRGQSLRDVSAELSRRGIKLTLAEERDSHKRNVWLSRAKIFLDLLRAPHDFAALRVSLGMACGALVVSEDCGDTSVFRPGEHLVTAPPGGMAGVIEQYLKDVNERLAIARRGQQFVTQELTLAECSRRMLARIKEQFILHP